MKKRCKYPGCRTPLRDGKWGTRIKWCDVHLGDASVKIDDDIKQTVKDIYNCKMFLKRRLVTTREKQSKRKELKRLKKKLSKLREQEI